MAVYRHDVCTTITQLHIFASTHHCNSDLPVFPASPLHNLILLQVLPPVHCHWDWSNGFLPDHLPVKGGGGKVLNIGTQWATE